MDNQSEFDVQQLKKAIASIEDAKCLIDTMLEREGSTAVDPYIGKQLTEASSSAFNAVSALNWALDEFAEES